jgi:hypothetical protein
MVYQQQMGMLCPDIHENFKMVKCIVMLVNTSCEQLLYAVHDATGETHVSADYA